MDVVNDINAGRHVCCAYDHPYFPLWREVWRRLDDHGAAAGARLAPTMVTVTKTPAHDTWETARAKGASWREWQLNRWADKGAKWAAQAQDVTPAIEASMKRTLCLHDTVAKWIGHVTHLAHCKDTVSYTHLTLPTKA